MALVRWIRRQNAPGAYALAGSLVVASLIFFFNSLQGMGWVAFTGEVAARPWTLITYPWALMGLGGPLELLFFFLLLFWMVQVGGMVEREMGLGRFVAAWFAFTLIGSLSMLLGGGLLGVLPSLAGPLLPIAAITIIWATRNPLLTVMLYGIVPIQARWIGVLFAAGMFFAHGMGSPLMGLFALIPMALAWALAANRIPGLTYQAAARKPKPTRLQVEREQREFAEIARRRQEREEKDRLRDLFERSGIEDK